MPLSLLGSSEKEKKPGLFERLKQAVASTKAQLVERIEEIVEGKQTVDQSVLDASRPPSLPPTWESRLRARFSTACASRSAIESSPSPSNFALRSSRKFSGYSKIPLAAGKPLPLLPGNRLPACPP